VKFTVGGRALELTKEQVETAMRGVPQDDIREHVVEMLGTVFPPKQVLAVVTGWDRQTYTTMEAQRVLTRLGFTCRRWGSDTGAPAWQLVTPQGAVVSDQALPAVPSAAPSVEPDRLATVEAQLATAMAAIAGLSARVAALEGAALL
jgi:hypothetical protein